MESGRFFGGACCRRFKTASTRDAAGFWRGVGLMSAVGTSGGDVSEENELGCTEAGLGAIGTV